jgi:hypothetical protein
LVLLRYRQGLSGRQKNRAGIIAARIQKPFAGKVAAKVNCGDGKNEDGK